MPSKLLLTGKLMLECRHAMNGLLRAGRVVCPLREAAEKARAAARAADALLEGAGMADRHPRLCRRVTPVQVPLPVM
jgi:hypothetical protein